jgi:hypothetical protein
LDEAVMTRLALALGCSEIAVNVSTVADSNDDNDQARLVDLVDDPMVAGPDPVQVFQPFELLRSNGPGSIRQAKDLGVNPTQVGSRQ